MEKEFNYKSKIVKGFIAFAIATSVTVAPSLDSNLTFADEKQQAQSNEKSSGEIVKVDENIARIDLNENITYSVDENGVATLKDKNTKKSEKLPTSAKDKNGKDVNLVYFEEDGKLGVQVVNKQQTRGAGKCIIGTAGGAIGGATTGGLGGAAVGTVTLPVVGTVSAGVVGAVGGGIGGASGGYVAGC